MAALGVLAAAILASCRSGPGEQTTPAPAAPAPAMAERRSLPAPEYLSADARLLLGERMQRHGYDMTNLLWAMVFLENEVVAEIAEAIATEPSITEQSGETPDALDQLLPQRFFELQRQLTSEARALATIARKSPMDTEGVSAAFGKLSRTCVSCHSTYLYGDAAAVASDEGK